MKPDTIIIHCSATREDKDFSIQDVDRSHAARKFKRPIQSEVLKHVGYQYYVRKNGDIEKGRHEDEVGAHCLGYNNRSVGICYEGGLDCNGKAKDTRTQEQKEAINNLVNEISRRWDIIAVIGHRDTSPDLNGNGKVDPFERIKECPCYDVIPEYPNFLPEVVVQP